MQLFAFLIILASAMAGFVGIPVWAIAVTAPMLVIVSMIEYRRTYIHASQLGECGASAALSTLSLSLVNAVIASGGGYLLGAVLRVI